MKDWIVKTLLIGWLKPLLNKLPLKGLMTVFGFVVVALGEVLKMPLDTSTSQLITLVVQILQGLGADNITNTGEVVAIIGAVRKALNFWALWKAWRKANPDAPVSFKVFYAFAIKWWKAEDPEVQNDGGWRGAGNPA